MIAGVFDRWRLRRLADWMRKIVSVRRVERALSNLMRTSIRMVLVETGGCAIDVDTEEEYDAICADHERLLARVRERADAATGPMPLSERSESEAS